MAMAEMIPFRYAGFYDVPRFILLRHRGQAIYLQAHLTIISMNTQRSTLRTECQMTLQSRYWPAESGRF